MTYQVNWMDILSECTSERTDETDGGWMDGMIDGWVWWMSGRMMTSDLTKSDGDGGKYFDLLTDGWVGGWLTDELDGRVDGG